MKSLICVNDEVEPCRPAGHPRVPRDPFGSSAARVEFWSVRERAGRQNRVQCGPRVAAPPAARPRNETCLKYKYFFLFFYTLEEECVDEIERGGERGSSRAHGRKRERDYRPERSEQRRAHWEKTGRRPRAKRLRSTYTESPSRMHFLSVLRAVTCTLPLSVGPVPRYPSQTPNSVTREKCSRGRERPYSDRARSLSTRKVAQWMKITSLRARRTESQPYERPNYGVELELGTMTEPREITRTAMRNTKPHRLLYAGVIYAQLTRDNVLYCQIYKFHFVLFVIYSSSHDFCNIDVFFVCAFKCEKNNVAPLN